MYIPRIIKLRAALMICLLLFPLIGRSSPDLNNFSIVFSDEFNGSSLDASKWNTGLLWGPYLSINNEEQLYVDELGINASSMLSNGGQTPSPFEFTGSTLKISAIPANNNQQIPARPAENSTIWQNYPEYRYNGDDPNDPNDDYYDPADVNYLSGVLSSYDSFRYTHGYAEARIKLPAGQGLWPAFWLSTSFYVEDVPEIDIVEALGHDTQTVYHTYHYFEPLNNWNKISTPSYTSSHADFTQQWHTFGVLWDPKQIVWYVDGQETRRITSDDYDIPNQAMYVIANLAVGGNWPGSPDSTTSFPAEMELDYIRIYQQDTPSTITQSVLDSDYYLMFEDEFNGNSLDSAKWNTHHLWGPYWQINNEEQFYPDVADTHAGLSFPTAPVSVSGGTLKLSVDEVSPSQLPVMPAQNSAAFNEHREWRHNGAYNNPGYTNPNNDPALAPQPFLPDYTGGIVTTYESFKFTHGYAEIRAKLPAGDGLWPAFWLLNGYYVDQQPEIDVIELRGSNPNELIHSYHLSTGGQGPSSYSWSSFSNATNGFADDFHTYGIAWEPGKLDWYVDGIKKHTHTGSTVSSQVMYVILNLAAGGNFTYAAVDNSNLPAHFEVDYVRVYQTKSAEPVPLPGDFVAANQSSTFGSAVASRASDGDSDGNWSGASLSTTTREAQAWWTGDLGSVIDIAAVDVYNRTDCCASRLSDFYVLVSDTPFTTNNLNTLLADSSIGSYYHSGAGAIQESFTIGRTGRYVRVQLTGTNYLSLAEVEVTPGLIQPTIPAFVSSSQSSTFGTAVASRATDGDNNGAWSGASLSTTTREAQAWWSGDLGQIIPIDTVEVFNRTDCCGSRLSDFYVLVSDSPFTTGNLNALLADSNVSAYYHAGAASNQEDFAVGRTGRYVRIQLSGTNYLSLAEINVTSGQPTPTTLTFASSSQSSTFGTATASRAADGNDDGNWSAGSIAVTTREAQAWWTGDLGQVTNINTVDVFNRTDCCGSRLSNFYVLVSDSPFGPNTLNALLADPNVGAYYHSGAAGSQENFSIGRTGRYVRIQLSGTNYLSLAEIKVQN